MADEAVAGAGSAGAGAGTGGAASAGGDGASTPSKTSFWEPTRAYVCAFVNEDGSQRVGPSNQSVIDELTSRGVEVVTKTPEQLLAMTHFDSTDLVVGPFTWTKHVAKVLGITMPEPPDYPACLQHHLQRKIWKSTLGAAHAAVEAGLPGSPPFDAPSFFIKPATDVKAFSGGVEPKDSMLGFYLADWNPQRLSPDLPVWCAEIVRFSREYRVYVVRGEIRAVCRYIALDLPAAEVEAAYDAAVDTDLDMAVVEAAVKALFDSDEGAAIPGCALDFGVMTRAGAPSGDDGGAEGGGSAEAVTALIEVNEGYSLGKYKGVSGKDFTDLLIARWGKLLQERDSST